MNKKELIAQIKEIDQFNIFKTRGDKEISTPFNVNDAWGITGTNMEVKQLRKFKKILINIYKDLPKFLADIELIESYSKETDAGYNYMIYKYKYNDLYFYDNEIMDLIGDLKLSIS